ncbi:MAG: hypothetical protein QM696_12660 [Steroidobacteraceae bacterium]
MTDATKVDTSASWLPEQQFFSDPSIDRLLGVVTALAGEVYVLRSRSRQLERTLRRKGILSGDEAAEFSLLPEDEQAEARDAGAFTRHVLQSILGEQQSRGPL